METRTSEGRREKGRKYRSSKCNGEKDTETEEEKERISRHALLGHTGLLYERTTKVCSRFHPLLLHNRATWPALQRDTGFIPCFLCRCIHRDRARRVAIAALTEYAARKLSEPEPDTECPASHIRLLFAISAILFFNLLNCELNSELFLRRKIIIRRVIGL